METAKPWCQRWNSLDNCFGLSFPKYLENFKIIRVLLQENRKNRSWIQGDKHNIPKILFIDPCLISKLRWKFKENPLICFFAILLTDTDSPKNEKNTSFKGLNGTSPKFCRMYLAPCSTNLENFMKIYSCVCRNVANRQTDKHTNQQRWNHNFCRSMGVNRDENLAIDLRLCWMFDVEVQQVNRCEITNMKINEINVYVYLFPQEVIDQSMQITHSFCWTD